MRRLAAIAALIALATPVLAQEDDDPVAARYTAAFDACLESPEGQSTNGMIQCIGQELEVQDAALNAAYRNLLADLSPAQKAKVQKAQRAWIAFRDADCIAHEDGDWGTLSRVSANMCMLQRTVRRTIELETFGPE